MRVMTFSGSVAIFTSDRPLAQAHEDTSHMKENTAVTTKSWQSTRQHNHLWNQKNNKQPDGWRCRCKHKYSQFGAPCCFHGTSPVWKSIQRGLPWSRGKKRQQWWQRTQLRMSSPRPGRNDRGSLPYRWERQSKPDGAWEQRQRNKRMKDAECLFHILSKTDCRIESGKTKKNKVKKM